LRRRILAAARSIRSRPTGFESGSAFAGGIHRGFRISGQLDQSFGTDVGLTPSYEVVLDRPRGALVGI
jgi:hypothetical protein